MPEKLTLIIDDSPVCVPEGLTLAAAFFHMQVGGHTRCSVRGEARAPLCGMGICQECRVSVNGVRRLACQTLCRDRMAVRRS